MTDAQGKEEGICAGLGLEHGLPWDGGSTRAHTHKDKDTEDCVGILGLQQVWLNLRG